VVNPAMNLPRRWKAGTISAASCRGKAGANLP
jgi:hypothetical protein